MTKIVIKVGDCYVTGFSKMHQIVQTTSSNASCNLDFAKDFKTEAKAKKFVESYADAGYGLCSSNLKIVKLRQG